MNLPKLNNKRTNNRKEIREIEGEKSRMLLCALGRKKLHPNTLTQIALSSLNEQNYSQDHGVSGSDVRQTRKIQVQIFVQLSSSWMSLASHKLTTSSTSNGGEELGTSLWVHWRKGGIKIWKLNMEVNHYRQSDCIIVLYPQVSPTMKQTELPALSSELGKVVLDLPTTSSTRPLSLSLHTHSLCTVNKKRMGDDNTFFLQLYYRGTPSYFVPSRFPRVGKRITASSVSLLDRSNWYWRWEGREKQWLHIWLSWVTHVATDWWETKAQFSQSNKLWFVGLWLSIEPLPSFLCFLSYFMNLMWRRNPCLLTTIHLFGFGGCGLIVV